MEFAIDTTAQLLRNGLDRLITQRTPTSLPPEEGLHRRSSHPIREFVFALAGACHYMLADRIYELMPGTLMLIDAWLPHADGYTKTDHGLLHLWGHFFEDGLQLDIVSVEREGQISSPLLRRPYIPRYIWQAVFERWNRLAASKSKEEEQAMALLRTPFNLLLEEAAFSLLESQSMPSHDALIAFLQSHIRSQNGKGCTLERLQKISGLSRFYLCRRFRQTTGCTIGEFIDQIRLGYVHAAIAHGQKQKEIAFELGFSSVTAYWNWYQKHRKSGASSP